MSSQSLEYARFIIDTGIATGITVQYKNELSFNPVWLDRSIGRKYAPPEPNFIYRLKPQEESK